MQKCIVDCRSLILGLYPHGVILQADGTVTANRPAHVEGAIAGRTENSGEANQCSHEVAFLVLTERLLGAFLAYRYDIGVKPDELYSAHDRQALKQQIMWNLRHFINPLVLTETANTAHVERSASDSTGNSGEAKQ